MKILTTTNARKILGDLVDRVKYTGEVIGIGRRNSVDAILMKFPSNYNKKLSEITNINANSNSFDFLNDEEEIYSLSDLKKKYG